MAEETIEFTPEQETEITSRISKSLEDYKANNPALNLETAAGLIKKSGGRTFLSEDSYKTALSEEVKPLLEEKATSILGNFKGDLKRKIKSSTGVEWEDGEDAMTYYERSLGEYSKDISSKSGDTVKSELLGVKNQLTETLESKKELEEKLKTFMSEKRSNEIGSLVEKAKGNISLDGDYYRDDITKGAVMSQIEKSFYDQYEIEQTENGGYLVKNKSNGAAVMNGQEIETIDNVFLNFAKGLDNVKYAQGGQSFIPGSGGSGASKEQIRTAINKAVEQHPGKNPMHREVLTSVKELGGDHALREYMGSDQGLKQIKEQFPELA